MINNINTRKAGLNSINISWKIEDESILLCNVLVNNNGSCKTIGIDPKLTNLTIPDLQTNSLYEIQIKALNEHGWHTSKIIEVNL